MFTTSRTRVLLAHEHSLLAAGVAATLSAESDFEVLVPGREEGAASLMQLWLGADVAVADYDTALELLSTSAGRGRVLILTHEGGETHIRVAIEKGARGYLLLGCSVGEFIDSIRSVSRGGTALARSVTDRIADSLSREALTPRELAVLRVLMAGLSNKAIARRLAVSVGTVKTHVKAIFEKLNVAGRTEAVAIAQRMGSWPRSCRVLLRRGPGSRCARVRG